MRLRSVLAGAALLGALAMPSLAAAAVAYALPGTSNMRAGPGVDYPVIARILGGSPVEVIGCLPDYLWCDSVVQGYRGWVSTSRLEFAYAGRRVLVPQYYAYFGAPLVGFDFGYWDSYYRDRPFYRDRDYWRTRYHRGSGNSHDNDRPRDSDRPRDDDRNRVWIPPNEGGDHTWRKRDGSVVTRPPRNNGGPTFYKRPPGVGGTQAQGDPPRNRQGNSTQGGGNGGGRARQSTVCPVNMPNC